MVEGDFIGIEFANEHEQPCPDRNLHEVSYKQHEHHGANDGKGGPPGLGVEHVVMLLVIADGNEKQKYLEYEAHKDGRDSEQKIDQHETGSLSGICLFMRFRRRRSSNSTAAHA